MSTLGNQSNSESLDAALDLVNELVMGGLHHGFFELTIKGEIVKERKRRLIVQSGKSHQFTIAEEQLWR